MITSKEYKSKGILPLEVITIPWNTNNHGIITSKEY
jgi:hypothetical protein